MDILENKCRCFWERTGLGNGVWSTPIDKNTIDLCAGVSGKEVTLQEFRLLYPIHQADLEMQRLEEDYK